MQFIALQELAQGQQPGEVFETTEAMGAVLVLVGAARAVEPESPPRGRYRRTDLQADRRALAVEP